MISQNWIPTRLKGKNIKMKYLTPCFQSSRSSTDPLNAGKAFNAKVKTSLTNQRDYIEGKEYSVLRLQGEGSLKKVSDPFMVMRKLFLSNGWKEDLQYAADGHGSSSFAYRKETYFCIASVLIDSGCDDEETGHVPSKFWFSIDCRESNIK